VIGVDLAEVAASVRLPRHLRSRVEVRGADLTIPGAQLPAADVVLCHGVLHEVADPTAIVRNLAEAMRPKGQLVGSCFTTDYYLQNCPEAVEAALRTAGFADVETWVEDVAVQVAGGLEQPYLERVLRQSLNPEQLVHLTTTIGSPLVLDLAPLHFRARVPEE
jgi:2-polyprenyl-3-methyl-5-hydroxy-6-metoxy-1,4-benzoquinol methylase